SRTFRPAVSIAVASAIRTVTFFWRRRMWRMGIAMSAGFSAAVATWYSSGWKRWWLRRSRSVTWTEALRSARAAARPPNPPPMITTWGMSQITCATRAGKGGSTSRRKIDENPRNRGGGLPHGGRPGGPAAERPVHRRRRHEQRPRLLRSSAGEVAEHRPAREDGREVRPRLLSVPALQSEPVVAHDRPPSRYDARLQPHVPLPEGAARRRHAVPALPEQRRLRGARRKDLPLREPRGHRHQRARRQALVGSRPESRRPGQDGAGARDHQLHAQARPGIGDVLPVGRGGDGP